MPKITTTGGPSYVGVEGGGGQSAAPFQGPPDAPKSAALTYEGTEPVPAPEPDGDSTGTEEPSPGISSSESGTKPGQRHKPSGTPDGSPARTTESPTSSDRTEGPSARSTATGRTKH